MILGVLAASLSLSGQGLSWMIGLVWCCWNAGPSLTNMFYAMLTFSAREVALISSDKNNYRVNTEHTSARDDNVHKHTCFLLFAELGLNRTAV